MNGAENIKAIEAVIGKRVVVAYRTIGLGNGTPEEQESSITTGMFTGQSTDTGRTVRYQFMRDGAANLSLFADEIVSIAECDSNPSAVVLTESAQAWECPKCGETDQLSISVQIWVKLNQIDIGEFETEDTGSNHEWDETSQMECAECGHRATVKEFGVSEVVE